MSDSQFPPPLGDELLSSSDRTILGSAAADVPGPHGKANLLRALGAAGVIGAASTVGTASQAATVGAAATSATAGLGAATFLKIGGTLAVVGALAGGAWTASHPTVKQASAPQAKVLASSVPQTATVASAPATVSQPVPPVPPVSPVPPVPVAAPAPVEVPSAIPPRVTRPLAPPVRPILPPTAAPIAIAPALSAPPVAAPPHAASIEAHDLEHEANALATAREALARGDAAAALAALDRYDASYPSGQLHREASILRARALSSIP
jgi:hypothetical protein